jgi:hypothetical protein
LIRAASNQLLSESRWESLLKVLAVSLSVNPFTNVGRAIPELDAVRFTAFEKLDGVSIYKSQVLQVEDNSPALSLVAK